MGYPVFASGDVLNASDMNAVGMWLVKTQTVGTGVSSVTVTGAFSSDYDNYRVTYTNGSGSTVALVFLTLGSANTGYYSSGFFVPYTGAGSANQNNNGSSFTNVGVMDSNYMQVTCNLYSPNLARRTLIDGNYVYLSGAYSFGGYLNDTTQYTAFTLTAQSGTMTGGTIRVYGFRN